MDVMKVKHAKKLESMKTVHTAEIARLQADISGAASSSVGDKSALQRIELLESELNMKSRELEHAKKDLEDALQAQVAFVKEQHGSSQTAVPVLDASALTANLQVIHQQELEALRRRMMDDMERKTDPLKDEIRELQSDLRDLVREKEQALRQLHEEKSKHLNEVSSLQAEILKLREAARQPTTPAMHQFMVRLLDPRILVFTILCRR